MPAGLWPTGRLQVCSLSLLDTYAEKSDPLCMSVARTSFKSLYDTFFDHVAQDVKTMFAFEKCPLVAELKFKMCKTLQIRTF